MSRQISITDLQQMKQASEKIACLTAYDACFAHLQDEAGIDIILVGDSLGMVLQGAETTLSVSIADMIYHTRMVSAGCKRPLIITDMPFMSYATPAQAVGNAGRLVAEAGSHVVKLEGGSNIADAAAMIVQHGIPVCGHLGLTPQSIHQIGGYRIQGNTEQTAAQLLKDALVLEQAGVACLVLECVPSALAAEISQSVSMPVIGIGAGPDCDGQVLVAHDMLGMTSRQPKFSKNFLQGNDSVLTAFKNYVSAVKEKSFPEAAHSYD